MPHSNPFPTPHVHAGFAECSTTMILSLLSLPLPLSVICTIFGERSLPCPISSLCVCYLPWASFPSYASPQLGRGGGVSGLPPPLFSFCWHITQGPRCPKRLFWAALCCCCVCILPSLVSVLLLVSLLEVLRLLLGRRGGGVGDVASCGNIITVVGWGTGLWGG